MADKRYSSLDETSLRNLLDGTVDLDERRLIRTAIRDLRRREIEVMEAALASKRFRAAPHRHDDKENQHRSDLADSLDLLSGKIQAIHSVDELTGMLRVATEYEERKLIRTAIRQLREQEIQGALDRVKPSSHQEVLQREPNNNLSLGDADRHKVEDVERNGHKPSRELRSSGSKFNMVLVLDPLVREKVSAPLTVRHQSDSGSPDAEVIPPYPECSDPTDGNKNPAQRPRLDSGASDRSAGSAYRSRLDSGASERSIGSAHRPRLDSGASERSVGSAHRPRLDSGASERSVDSAHRPRLDSGASERSVGSAHRPRLDSGASERSVGSQPPPTHAPGSGGRDTNQGTSSAWGGKEEWGSTGSSPSTDSEVEMSEQGQGCTGGDRPDGAASSRRAPGPCGGPANGSSTGPKDGSPEQKVTPLRDTSLVTLSNGKSADLSNRGQYAGLFNRAGSVRDRVRKFTEPNSTSPIKRGLQSSFRGAGPSVAMVTPSAPASDRVGKLQDSFGKKKNLSGGVAARAGQSQRAVGRPKDQDEKVGHVAIRSEKDRIPEGETAAGVQDPEGDPQSDMKTFLTIEIKDGRASSMQPGPSSSSSSSSSAGMTPRITTLAGGQRAELMLGLRATPFKMSTSGLSSGPSFKMETEPLLVDEPAVQMQVQAASEAPSVPNGSTETQAKNEAPGGKLTEDQLEAIEDEEILDRMLDDSKDFEERRMIRAAMRELRKKKRDQREKEREVRLQELRQQRADKARAGGGAGEVVMKKMEKSADGSTVSQVTKTNRFNQSDDGSKSTHSTIVEASYMQKSDRGMVQSKSYSYSSSSSSTSKKVGSVFDREDDSSRNSALERRQAEKKKELMRAQTLPKTSAMQARRAMIERLEKDSGGPGVPAGAHVNKVQRSTSFGVPNANSIKQMLLDWCRAKTRSYEVDIQNFSSSWSDGMAFCALVHNFFPEAFDYSTLSPSNRRQNFEVAFGTAEKLADCPQLLDVEDMVRMREPDWKCVYTYLQEFYRGLVQKGLVKTKNSS